ncbi:MAG: class D beta-lactamase [Chlamydiia bacterium]|nr:class D beta-lactamase [Chlamydiia bacterium]
MKRTILLLSIGLLLNVPLLAEKQSFLAKEKNRIIRQEGDCQSRHAPCSTFKIPISLMGYNEELLIDETHPELPFQEGYVDYIENWKQPHHPALWLKHSCVWFSQVLTQQIGMKKFREYVAKFDYGNMDVSGDKGQNNGLTRAWLSSSLEISPEEQVAFLQKLLDNKLPVSLKSHEMTRAILFVEDLPNDWKLYGKTGSGSLLDHDRTQKLDIQMGWFVGWIQNGQHTIVFAQYLEDEEKCNTYASLRAKAYAKQKLMHLIEAL